MHSSLSVTDGIYNILSDTDLEERIRNLGKRASQEPFTILVLPLHSLDKFRHGHAVYALKKAKEVSALKAVSQNLMHSNLSVTDGVYGILSESDVKGQIMALGEKISSGESDKTDDLIPLLEQLLANLKTKKGS